MQEIIVKEHKHNFFLSISLKPYSAGHGVLSYFEAHHTSAVQSSHVPLDFFTPVLHESHGPSSWESGPAMAGPA